MESHPHVRAVQDALDAAGAQSTGGGPSKVVVLTPAELLRVTGGTPVAVA
jgi:hypothetical protein